MWRFRQQLKKRSLLAKNSKLHARNKRIDIRCHHKRDLYKNLKIKIEYFQRRVWFICAKTKTCVRLNMLNLLVWWDCIEFVYFQFELVKLDIHLWEGVLININITGNAVCPLLNYVGQPLTRTSLLHNGSVNCNP